MVLQNYQNFIEMTSNMIYIVALGGGFKCPRKIQMNTVRDLCELNRGSSQGLEKIWSVDFFIIDMSYILQNPDRFQHC